MTEAIEARDLKKIFSGKREVRALDGVSFAVEEGTVFGLLGPNGAGKTTAVRVLTTIIKPDAGVARVLGHDVTKEAGLVRSLSGWPASTPPSTRTHRSREHRHGRAPEPSPPQSGGRAGPSSCSTNSI